MHIQKILLGLAIIIAISGITMAFKEYQQEKEATLRLSKGEMEILYNLVDDAAAPGSVRKPLLQKIAVAYEATWPQRPQQSILKDSTNKKKN